MKKWMDLVGHLHVDIYIYVEIHAHRTHTRQAAMERYFTPVPDKWAT